MNGSPPVPLPTVAPVPTVVLVAAETNAAGTNIAITVITAKAIASFFTFILLLIFFGCFFDYRVSLQLLFNRFTPLTSGLFNNPFV
jgi:hypothetical protein